MGWSLLNGRLELWDIDDAERFARHVIERTARRDALGWPEWKREELLADSVAHLWELSIRYKPEIGTFSGYAGRFLRFYIIDWIRYREGRTKFKFGPDATHIRLEFRQSGGVYERPRREQVSIDGELAESLGSGSMDTSLDCDSDFRGALTRGDSPEAWEAAEMGVDDAGGTEKRAA